MASPPAPPILSATTRPPLSSRSVSTTLAPSRTSVVAQAAPIPDAPPVTIATCPSTCLIGVLPSSSQYQLVSEAVSPNAAVNSYQAIDHERSAALGAIRPGASASC